MINEGREKSGVLLVSLRKSRNVLLYINETSYAAPRLTHKKKIDDEGVFQIPAN